MRRSKYIVNVSQNADVPQRPWIMRAYLWVCERLYAELAGIYDLVSWFVSFGQWRRWQSGVWKHVRGGEVLEVGCGTGVMLVQGNEQGLSLVGVDRSSAMLAVAQRRLKRINCHVPILMGDGRSLPLADGCFDSVIATFPAGYILEPSTLEEIRRVLRDDGRLVILGLWVELNVESVNRLFPVFYGRPSVASMNGISQRVADAGFRVRWVEEREGQFTVGVLIAEREP